MQNERDFIVGFLFPEPSLEDDNFDLLGDRIRIGKVANVCEAVAALIVEEWLAARPDEVIDFAFVVRAQAVRAEVDAMWDLGARDAGLDYDGKMDLNLRIVAAAQSGYFNHLLVNRAEYPAGVFGDDDD